MAFMVPAMFRTLVKGNLGRATNHAMRRRTVVRRPLTASARPPSVSQAEAEAAARGEPTMVRARHILVETEAMVDALKQQVEEGAEFDKLAESVSTCPSKAKGGDLGWFKRRQMVPQFEEVVFENQPGSVVKVHTQFGWHLVKVEGHGVSSGSISVEELKERWPSAGFGEEKEVQFVDCRERGELELAKLEGFLNLPMGEYGEWADDFDKGNLGLDKNKETVVMCHHGVRSANFCQFMAQQGYKNVRNLVGGIDAYSLEVDDSIPRY